MNLNEIVEKVKTQGTTGTCSPRLIILEEKKEVLTAIGNGDRTYYWSNEMECQFTTKHECEKYCKEHGLTAEEIDETIEQLNPFEVKDEWKPHNWFFSFEGYEAHVRLNKHNYRGEIRPYVVHCFRNPEMEAIWKHLFGATM